MTKLKITVDKTKCIGSASCVVIAPQNFDLGTDGKSFPIIEITSENLEAIKKAANACPVNAITLQKMPD